MARPDMRGNEAGKAQEGAISSEVATQAAELVAGRAKEDERPRRFGASRVLTAADRDRILKDARSVEFPAALRGYDRAAVDRYVERINRLITELEMSSSPEAAVRHALDEVSEETRDILQRAHDTAEEITARSRDRADDRVQKAESEIQVIREAAEREVSELRETAAQEVSELRDTAAREAADARESAATEAADTRESAARESQRVRATAQRDAEETRETARREAEEMIEAAETRARDLGRSAEAIWRERRRLIDDMRGVGEQLLAIGETEGKRFPRFGEEGSVPAELLRESGTRPPAAGLVPDRQANGTSEVIPG